MPCGDVVRFFREGVRRRLVVPLMVGGAARTGQETCPYTIYAWFLRKKGCLTGLVTWCDEGVASPVGCAVFVFGAARIYPCTIYAFWYEKHLLKRVLSRNSM
jgi:hypothetical protein